MQTLSAKRAVRAERQAIPVQGRHPTAGRAGSYAVSGVAIALSLMALVFSSGGRLLHSLTLKVNAFRISESGRPSAIGPQAPPAPDQVAIESDLSRMPGVLEALRTTSTTPPPTTIGRCSASGCARDNASRSGVRAGIGSATRARCSSSSRRRPRSTGRRRTSRLPPWRSSRRSSRATSSASSSVPSWRPLRSASRTPGSSSPGSSACDRTSTTQADFERGQNLLDLARAKRAESEALVDKKLRLAETRVKGAEHRLRRAQSELLLADFKRGMSWANVPVARGQFEEVVVTKISAARGDVPNATGRKDVWIEVVDDRVLQVRTFLTVAQAGRVEVGREVVVHQGDRTYAGRVDAIGVLADERTHLIPALVRVENTDRKLKIHTEVTVDFLASAPSAL